MAHLADVSPLRAGAVCDGERLRGNDFKGFQVPPFGVNFYQLGMNGDTRGVGAQGFLQDFLGLQIAAVGQVDIGFGDWVYISGCIQLVG